MMDADKYQRQAIQTSAFQPDEVGIVVSVKEVLAWIGLNVSGEGGEFANYAKKVLYHGHPLERAKILAELGDLMWYVAVGAALLGEDLSKLMADNIAKLKVRYPDGFSSERSINRPLEE